MEKIQCRATVNEIRKGGLFQCYLEQNEAHFVIAHLCGKMRQMRIVLCVGDDVTLELSPYDLRRGRIIWRH